MTRDDSGRFVKGVSGNPKGRAPKKREEDYLSAMSRIVTPERWEAIVDRAARDAEKGDTAARKWLSDYLMGTPVQKQEVTGADGGALRIVVEYVDASPTQD